MKLFELFIALLLGAICRSSSASNVSQNGCPPELNACLQIVKAHEICSSLNKICAAIENGNATQQIRTFEANRCNGSDVFCPLTRDCLPSNSTCDVNTVASRHKQNVTPWSANCSAGQEFCSISMSCIPVNSTCSLKAIYDWKLNGNMTYGPYGQVCSAGQTFCLATMSCIASANASCEVPYNVSAFGTPCKNNDTLCRKNGACIAMNSTCNPFPSVNMTGRPNPGRGWKQLCQVRQSVCIRSLVGLARCFPKVSHCEEERNNTQPSSPQAAPSTTALPTTALPTTAPSCGANQTFCEGAGRCMFSNETCCPRNQYNCHSQGRCIAFHEPCPYEVPSDPCPPRADPCKETLSKSGALCEGRFSVCDALVNGNASTFSQAVSAVNQMACRGNGTYCPLNGVCIPSGAPCTLDSFSSNNNSAPSNYSNQTSNPPWGVSCPRGKSFCDLTMQCENECSPRNIYEWIINGNTTYGPYGRVCNASTKFCFATMSCVSANATCKYDLMTPHGNAGNASLNASSSRNSSHIDDLCERHDGFCLTRLKCVPGGNDCSAFPNLSYTGVNDTGTGWMQACKISNPLCQRKKYGVDKCFALLGKCLAKRNVTKYRCFEPRFTYSEQTKTCINASDLSSCSLRETFCPARNRCINASDYCCSLRETFCPANNRCINASDYCCSLRETFCPARNSCINASDYCCPPGETFCNYSRRCIPNGSPCSQCPIGQTFCSKNSTCIRSSDYCLAPGECPPYQTNCPLLGRCINNTIPCLPPQSKIIYKTVWFFEKLQDITPSLFPSGNTIAITSISNTDGSFVYYNGSAWVPVSGISPSSALVLGKTSRINFMPRDTAYHGVILLNYTVISGTVGAKIDASSSAREADDVIAIVLLPYHLPTQMTRKDVPCIVKEDSRSNNIALKDLLNITSRNVSHEKNIPDEILPFLQRSTAEYYLSALKSTRMNRDGIAAINLENDPRRGSFRGEPSVSRASPVIKDKSGRFNFIPTLNYHGPFNASFTGVHLVKYSSDYPIRSLQFSPYVSSIINIFLYGKNASLAVMNAYKNVLRDLDSKKSAPSKANVMSSIDALISKGSNVEALNTVKTLFTQTFEYAALETSGVEAPPPYAPTTVTLSSGERFYVQYSDKIINLGCKVIPINDAPVLTSFVTFFPPIPYNLSTTPYNGFNVSEITTRIPIPYGSTPPKFSKPKPFIQDVDGDVPGIAIVYAKNSSLGAYYYKTPGSSWQLIDLNNTLVNGKPQGRGEVLLLKPKSSLKFQMHDPDALWSNSEGRKKANLFLAAWDQSDNQTDGVHYFYFPTDNNASISKKYASAFTARYGCDNKPGSRGRIDSCGRCGGDGLWCRGCDDVPFSGARIDHCGNCTGGTTNKTFNFRKDCGGGCGTSFRDSCGVCQKYGKVKNFTDCSGTCFGKARINKCGQCVLGSTGKPATFGEDLCGICGGSNTTCLDCANVPRGTKKIDICGNCLEPTESRFDSQCVKLGNMNPISGRHNSPTRVTVVGAGLQSYSTATCQFVNDSGIIANLATANIRNKRFVISTVNISIGRYALRCQFDSLSNNYYTLNNFTFYDSSAITYSSVTPNETEANTRPINATIAGSGFPDTGYVRCISDTKISSPAFYVDSSTVTCLLPNLPKSANLKVAVSFGESDNTVGPGALAFQFFATSPYPTAISFSQNLQALIVTMNKPAEHRGRSCTGIFSAESVSSFGSRAKCVLRTPVKMYVALLGRPSIKPGDSVTFNNGSLNAKFEKAVKNESGTIVLVVQGPPRAIVPTARLSGPNKAGACAKVRLDASASSGAGGRRLNFTWTVGWSADQDMGALTSNATADLSSIQTTLENLPSFSPRLKFGRNNLVLGFKYEFKVQVLNFLGEESENASLVVERENRQLPILAAGRAKRKVKASRNVVIQARAILSPCLDPNSVANNVLFNWEIDAVGIDLKVTDKPRLRIKKGTLQGGRQYTLTVTASMATDQTLSTTKDIVLDVQSSPLVAKIRGGSYRVVGATSTLTLDGRKSFDPDRSSDSEWYEWECEDSTGEPCFVPDPSNPGRKIRLVLSSTAKISIDVGANLEANSRYKFIMTYNKGSRKASKTVVIKVEPGSPPDVEIRPQVNTKENPNSIIIIKAIAKSTMQANNASWECVDEDGFGFVDLSASGVALTPLNFNFKKKIGRSRVSKNFALVIAANTLANGVSYKFRANVAHADSSAAGETIVTTNAAPSQGTLEVTPSNGTAMDTLFKFSASEGWSDDPDDLPLKYQFGYFKKGSSGKEILLGLFGEPSEVEDIKLPPGDDSNSNSLTVFVDCKDALGAVTRQTATITVMPKVIDTAFLASAQGDILKAFESADWNSALGNMGALLSSLPSGSSDPNQTSAVTEMKEAFASNTLGILQNGGVADDPAAKKVMYESMGPITDGGSSMSDSTKKNIRETILGLETGSSSSKRRRRRDVDDSSSVEVFTVSQAETTISLVSNLVDPNLYDSSTMSSKSSVLSLAASSGIKVCAGLALGMPASIVKDKLLVLRIEKNSLATADTEYVDMACDDCPSSLHKSARIRLGASLQSTYSSWSCASETTCSGVCLVTSQQTYDLLSTAFNNRTLTHVVDFKIYNPETYAAISISTLSSPVSFLLPVLENKTLSNETFFQCHRWDSGSSSWTASSCVTNPTAVEGANGTKYINCSCTEVSYHVVFQVDSLPTEAPTTIPATIPTEAPTNPTIITRRARFALVGDYDTLVTPAKEAQFKADVRTKIATVMKVSESNIVNITLSKGSIIVLFAYIPGPTDNDASMDAAISSLQAAVKNGNFSVTLSDGTVLNANPTSFSSTKDDTVPTVAAPEEATPESGLTETEVIIIAVVCGVLAVVILVIIVVCCRKKKNKESKVSPESSRAQLRDNDVEMADRGKHDGNYNEAFET